MRAFAVLVAAALAGCAIATEVHGPDGRPAYAVSCDGTALNWGHCFQKAGEVCRQAGYNVLSRSDEQGFAMGRYFTGTTSHRSMMVSCRA